MMCSGTTLNFGIQGPRNAQPQDRAPGDSGASASRGMAAAAAALAAVLVSQSLAYAQTQTPTRPTVDCRADGRDFVMPPEIVSSGGVLKGTVTLTEELQLMPKSGSADKTCAQQTVRVFRNQGDIPPPAVPEATELLDPTPGPTLRARVGDTVQLSLVNKVNPNRFDLNLDINACTQVGQGGSLYPAGSLDVFPNCLHASSTANIHFHGTHTNPNGTGDNVFLQVRPLPRDNGGTLTTTPAQVMEGFPQFRSECDAQLKNPLTRWPKLWSDLDGNPAGLWLKTQIDLLGAYQGKNPSQPLLNLDMADKASWPVYYIGAVPYCFALPAYTESTWPPPPGSGSPIMGQAPGTHWYHAHKHGSTAINVADGMTGAFIIEGKYDDDLNSFYGSFMLKDGPWNARSQPVLVLNQIGTTPNLLAAPGTGFGGAGAKQDFAVNGRIRPVVHMQPGEIQLWRIVNTSGRSAAYFMAPQGFRWKQLAQDGVQLAKERYVSEGENKPFYLAPANRVDLLVQAPMTQDNYKVFIQDVMARSRVKPTPVSPTADDPVPGEILMSIAVAGPPVTRNGRPLRDPMPFIAPRWVNPPPFLADITDRELPKGNRVPRQFTFNSKIGGGAKQHTINNCQFHDETPECKNEDVVQVNLRAVEEWKIENTTPGNGAPSGIDHPFHIHINPFQITEVFDPNENLVDLDTGQLLQLVDKDGKPVLKEGKTQPVPRYVTDKSALTDPNNPFAKRQCFLDPKNDSTWSVKGACGPAQAQPSEHLIWWDVFAIPSGRVESGAIIPGYFRMRSRFVDYPGSYVFHCHILIHEDRGMMFTVEVVDLTTPITFVDHHH
jgi:FtsP/CotA-like multicopper oxidase with cupredoxin domain